MNFDDILKKLCNIGLATAMSIGLFATMVNAAAPGASNKGRLLDDTPVKITKKDLTSTNGKDDPNNTATFVLKIDKNEDHIYDGKAYNIIKSLQHSNLLQTGGAKIYLRVADNKDDSASGNTKSKPVSDSGAVVDSTITDKSWVEYDYDKADFTDDYYKELKRTEKGAYYIYFYIDGGDNFEDVDATSPGE